MPISIYIYIFSILKNAKVCTNVHTYTKESQQSGTNQFKIIKDFFCWIYLNNKKIKRIIVYGSKNLCKYQNFAKVWKIWQQMLRYDQLNLFRWINLVFDYIWKVVFDFYAKYVKHVWFHTFLGSVLLVHAILIKNILPCNFLWQMLKFISGILFSVL